MALSVALQTPHHAMPNIMLDPQERADVGDTARIGEDRVDPQPRHLRLQHLEVALRGVCDACG